MTKSMKLNALDFFSGGVPAGAIFQSALIELRDLNKSLPSQGKFKDRLAEISFVGAMSYFEAFCKDHFASLINIYPPLLGRLSHANVNILVDAQKVTELSGPKNEKIGFIVSEKYDFGTAERINSLYYHLIGITPLSKKEMDFFFELQRDRNLIVHHAGIYTSEYLKQSLHKIPQDEAIPFFFSRVIDERDLLKLFEFLNGVASKLIKASDKSLRSIIVKDKIKLQTERRKALNLLSWWEDE